MRGSQHGTKSQTYMAVTALPPAPGCGSSSSCSCCFPSPLSITSFVFITQIGEKKIEIKFSFVIKYNNNNIACVDFMSMFGREMMVCPTAGESPWSSLRL